MIWACDRQGRGIYVCPEWPVVTGQSQSDALGLGWTTTVHPEDLPIIMNAFAEALRQRIEFMLRYRIRRANGAHMWVLSAASPSFTPLTHEFVGFLGVLSQYDDDAPNLTVKADIGSFKPGRAMADFSPLSPLDMAVDHLIMAKAVSLGRDAALTAAIDGALNVVGQALATEHRRLIPQSGKVH